MLSDNPDIRDSTPDDLNGIESLYPRAFPDEDLLPLVRALIDDGSIATSLVAATDEQIVGHGIFTRCGVNGTSMHASLLGPLAVVPERHGQGIGSEIVRAGLQRLERSGTSLVCVLGDPAFYQRLVSSLPAGESGPPGVPLDG